MRFSDDDFDFEKWWKKLQQDRLDALGGEELPENESREWKTVGGLDWPIWGHGIEYVEEFSPFTGDDFDAAEKYLRDYFTSLTQKWAEDLDAEITSDYLPGVKAFGGREIWVSMDGWGSPPPASVFDDDDLVCSIGLN